MNYHIESTTLGDDIAASLRRREGMLHPIVIVTHIEQTTASAQRRRKRSVWPDALLAVLALGALAAVCAGVW